MSRPVRVAVVGAGVTGLTAAYRLLTGARDAGMRIEPVLFESEGRVGGKVLSERVNGALLEGGPDSILTRKPWAVELCRELGLGEELVEPDPANAGAYVAHRGKLLPVPEGVISLAPAGLSGMLRTPLFSLGGKLRAGLEWFIPPRPPGGDESLAAFVGRRLGREALERLAEPLLAGIHAADADRLSLLATFPQLREAELKYGGLIRAMWARRRETARGGAGAPPFVSLSRGLERLPAALAGAVGEERIRLGRRVVSVRREAGGYALELAGGGREGADRVLFTTPAYVTADLLAPVAPEAAELIRQIPYASVAVVVLGYPRGAVELPGRGTGFVVPRAEGCGVTACTWASAKWPHVGGGSWTVLRAYLGRDGAPAPLEAPDEDLVRRVREELRRLMGFDLREAFARVYRWERGLPQYRPGHLELVERIEAALARSAGVFVAGAAYRGAGLPDCVREGSRAAEQILGSLKEEVKRGGEERLRVLSGVQGKRALSGAP